MWRILGFVFCVLLLHLGTKDRRKGSHPQKTHGTRAGFGVDGPKAFSSRQASVAENDFNATLRSRIPGTREANIKQTEDQIASSSVERAVAFSADGSRLLDKTGTRTSVVFTADEAKLMKGAVLTHNHPGGHSFSTDDVAFAVREEMAEMRVVTDDALYSLKPPAGGWGVDWAKERGLIPSLNAHNLRVRQNFQDRIDEGSLGVEEAAASHWHEVWKGVAQDTGFLYSRMPR